MQKYTEIDDEFEEREPTAQPKAWEETLIGRRADADLSVEPEDLGRHFLREAVEQSDVASATDVDDTERVVDGPAPTDTVTDADYAGAGTQWEATVNHADEARGTETTTEELPERKPRRASIDVTSPVIREASLLDREHATTGAVRRPRVRTEDQGRHRAGVDALIVPEHRTMLRSRSRAARPFAWAALSLLGGFLVWRLAAKRSSVAHGVSFARARSAWNGLSI